MMTQRLEEAFQEASKLSETDQNQLAEWILDALKSEQQWEILFEKSQDLLAQLADEALDEYHKGLTEELDPDKI